MLEFNPARKLLLFGGTREDTEIAVLRRKILEAANSSELLEREIDDVPLSKSLFSVPDPMKNNGNKKTFEGIGEDVQGGQKKLVPDISRISGNKKTRNEDSLKPALNSDEKLVPALSELKRSEVRI